MENSEIIAYLRMASATLVEMANKSAISVDEMNNAINEAIEVIKNSGETMEV